jgi:hypothetical protein
MEKEDTISVQWAQEDVETSYSLLNNNNISLYTMCELYPEVTLTVLQTLSSLELVGDFKLIY